MDKDQSEAFSGKKSGKSLYEMLVEKNLLIGNSWRGYWNYSGSLSKR